MTPVTYDCLPKPMTGATGTHPDAKEFTIAKADWNKRNGGALGLMQATISPVMWQNFVSYGKVHLPWAELKKQYGKVGGGLQPTSDWSTWQTLNSPI